MDEEPYQIDKDIWITKQYLLDHVSQAVLYEQLAEEALELSLAAFKIARIIRDENPTPVTMECAVDNLVEEYSDVCNISDLLNLKPNDNLRKSKLIRWNMRLLKKNPTKIVDE